MLHVPKERALTKRSTGGGQQANLESGGGYGRKGEGKGRGTVRQKFEEDAYSGED